MNSVISPRVSIASDVMMGRLGASRMVQMSKKEHEWQISSEVEVRF